MKWMVFLALITLSLSSFSQRKPKVVEIDTAFFFNTDTIGFDSLALDTLGLDSLALDSLWRVQLATKPKPNPMRHVHELRELVPELKTQEELVKEAYFEILEQHSMSNKALKTKKEFEQRKKSIEKNAQKLTTQ